MRRAAHESDLEHREVEQHPALLEHHRHPAGPLAGGDRSHGTPVQAHLPRLRCDDTAQEHQERGFSGAVRSDDPGEFPPGHGKGQSSEQGRRRARVRENQPMRGQDRVTQSTLLPPAGGTARGRTVRRTGP